MKKEVDYALKKFKNALERLREGAESAKTGLDRDGVIQRFEFTFELLWKGVKVCLEDKGIEAKTPKDCLKAAFRVGWIENEQIYLDMLEDRNKTSHLYDEPESEKIFQRIKTSYLGLMETLLRRLETALTQT